MIFEPTGENLARAGELLRNGYLVAFPTETVYGLGANALDSEAIAGIFQAKGRPSDNPLIVHVSDFEMAKPFLKDIDILSEKLGKIFWPGPLTIVLPIREDSEPMIVPNVSAGLDTVGIRVPDHPVALALLRECGVPLAAPSANKSGSPSPTTANHVLDDLGSTSLGHLGMILDGGPCRVGLESTVVQVRDEDIYILRPGGITAEMISNKLGIRMERIHAAYATDLGSQETPRAPGMKYRHYAPKAVVVAVMNGEWGPDVDVALAFDSTEIENYRHRFSLGSSPIDVEIASCRIFDLFRKADRLGAETVHVDCSFDRSSGLGLALWNRISKAVTRK
jgi:L-threonylcarbamoyladenylate synthase